MKSYNNDIFRKTLLNLRKQRQVSQEELGKYVGVNKSTISKYERGIIVPTLDIARMIAKFFGVTVEYLVNPEYDNKSKTINNNNVSELIGLPKEYIKAVKIAEANNISPQKLIELINFTISMRNERE
ncbi:MAG: helix-turn-helix transcriptional regulator [Vallitalea sp.]|jgi:transcriptional regulator with XRE-family HTH domain|nr:helix-turn-helix transcriptional regulator [Vallitalea sp.]